MEKISDNSRFYQRLEYFIKSKKIKQRTVAKKLNVSEGAINKWKNGTRFPKDDMRLLELAKALDVNLIDFFPYSQQNKKDIVINELKNNLNSYLNHIPKELIPQNIKIVPITKGYPIAPIDKTPKENKMQSTKSVFIDKRLIKEGYGEKELKAMVMVGDSMSPYLQHDDIAVYYPIKTPLGDGNYVINTPTYGLTVKRLKFASNGNIYLISENKKYNLYGNYDELFTKENLDTLEIYGLVVGRILKS